MQASSYLVYACDHLNKPQEVIARAFGDNFAALAMETTKLVRVQRHALQARRAGDAASTATAAGIAVQTENVRKMLLAFSRDLRVVMLRLASRLQTLRYFAATKLPVPQGLAAEALQVFAPLANRLGIWEIKWELEDLAFRFLEPDTYRQVARLLTKSGLNAKPTLSGYVISLKVITSQRHQRQGLWAAETHLQHCQEMRGKSLVLTSSRRARRGCWWAVAECYGAWSWYSHFNPVAQEFDDYIAKPKVNGFSRCTPWCAMRAANPPRSRFDPAMHDHENVAAHWAYKEAVPRAMQVCRPAASTTPRLPCCVSCWPGNAISSTTQTQAVLDDRTTR